MERGDTEAHLERAAAKVGGLRIFEDDQGRMNRGLDEVGGAVLAVSQFTLAASIRKGRRPGFDRAMPGPEAEPMFDRFIELLRSNGCRSQPGCSGP